MNGLMMDYQLTLRPIMERAAKLHPRKEIATKFGATMHRYTYADFYARANKLANALKKLGVQEGDRIGTLAWNTYRHLELYFALPCMGTVLHTLNLRLPPEQLVYIINHAEDSVIFVDDSLLKLLEAIAPMLKTVKHFVIMTNGDLPQTSLPNVLSYEALLADADDQFAWPDLNENTAAAMCYTSGTTGNPKGVLYSHRALYLHTLMVCMADTLGMIESDTTMAVVPMFHAMAWGVPYAATFVGAKQIYPGMHLQPTDLADLIQGEKITLTAGVPTLWLGLLQVLEKGEHDISSLRVMPVGGSAAPKAMIETYQKKYGVPILHAWGMTELAPVGTVSRLKGHMGEWGEADRFNVRAKQGYAVATVEIRAIGEDGREVPADGRTMGELQVRGPHIASSYYKDERTSGSFTEDGWFRTGDVITMDSDGYMQIVDRTKDLVKSGGEWISTVDLENALMGHPDVLEAAVIAAAHSKWQERPLGVVVLKPGAKTDKQALYDLLLANGFAKWQLPDEILFVEEIPKTSVGKFDKKVVRTKYANYLIEHPVAETGD